MRLAGVHVLVAGAGLAGLAAARALEQHGAVVSVIEARHRVGGRVWTLRDAFDAQHAEAGADLIESDQEAVVGLIAELGLRTRPILRRGFGYYEPGPSGRLAIQSMRAPWAALQRPMAELVAAYRLIEQRWNSPVARRLSRRSVTEWLDEIGADPWLRRRVTGFRGLFLADPQDLSLLALVDFLAADPFGGGHTVRIVGGNDRLATTLASRLAHAPELATTLRRVRRTPRGLIVTLDTPAGRAERRADYLVAALPATTLRDMEFAPALPAAQRTAIARLRYGSATRMLLQFTRRFWWRPGRPRAFGSDQPTGAVWDGNEHQRGPAGILSLLAGGGASDELQQIVRREGTDGVVRRLRWLGRPTRLLATRSVVWEDDRWARGGYAYFDPGYDPRWRDLLAKPFGRVVFAGEHTSIRWQGYVNGAVESGYRAAAEIAALHADAAHARR